MWQKRVLVAAEATAQGRQIVATAIAVAAQCGLPLHLVSVVPDEALRQPAAAFVIEMLNLAQAQNVEARGEARIGKPYGEILAARVECQADLIVMGSRGEARLGRALIGGVAQKVMGLSDQPVLVLNFLKFQGVLP